MKALRMLAGAVAVNVGGVELTQVTRGDTLCTPGAFESTRRVDVRSISSAMRGRFAMAARIRFHQGTTEVLGAGGDSRRHSSLAAAGYARDPVRRRPPCSRAAIVSSFAPIRRR